MKDMGHGVCPADPPYAETAAPRAISLHLWPDALLGLFLAVVAGIASFLIARLIDPVVLQYGEQYGDMWFDADIPRTFIDMTQRWASQHRTSRHPLFSLAANPPVYLLRKALELDPVTAVRTVVSVVAGLWTLVLFVLLRSIGCRRLDALIFTSLALVSASSIFWFVVPDTFPFGSLSILCALAFVAATHQRNASQVWYVLISALTLSFTITNWMAGVFATIVRHSWRQSFLISANALCVVAALWSVEKTIFPRSVSFLIWEPARNEFILVASPVEVINSFVFHSVIMPAIGLVQRGLNWPMMTVQRSLPGSGTVWGALAVPLWLVILGLGVWGLIRAQRRSDLRIVLVLTLLGQLALALLYGRETFLYSVHFAPLLVVLAAFGALTPARPWTLSLAVALVVLVGINNALQLREAIEFVRRAASP